MLRRRRQLSPSRPQAHLFPGTHFNWTQFLPLQVPTSHSSSQAEAKRVERLQWRKHTWIHVHDVRLGRECKSFGRGLQGKPQQIAVDTGSSLTINALFLKVWVRTVLFPQLDLLFHVHAVINDGWLGEGQPGPSSTLKCPVPKAGAGAAHSSRPLQGLGPCLGYRRCSLTHGTRTYCCLLWTLAARAASCPVLFLTQVAEHICYTTSGKHQALGVLHSTWCSQNPGRINTDHDI